MSSRYTLVSAVLGLVGLSKIRFLFSCPFLLLLLPPLLAVKIWTISAIHKPIDEIPFQNHAVLCLFCLGQISRVAVEFCWTNIFAFWNFEILRIVFMAMSAPSAACMPSRGLSLPGWFKSSRFALWTPSSNTPISRTWLTSVSTRNFGCCSQCDDCCCYRRTVNRLWNGFKAFCFKLCYSNSNSERRRRRATVTIPVSSRTNSSPWQLNFLWWIKVRFR